MDWELFKQAMVKYLSGVLLLGVLLFLPAGTLDWWQAWVFLCVLFIPMGIAGFIMMANAPDLLRKRLNVDESENEQKTVVTLSGLMFVAAFVLAGFGVRFGWPQLSPWVSIVAMIVFLVAYLLYAEVLRENEYLSRTIEVQEDQHVVDTGLYGIVRHPMYSVTLVLFLSMPLMLGSLPSFVVMLVYLPIIAKRILNEEQVLSAGLTGYDDYMTRVKWRLIPHVW